MKEGFKITNHIVADPYYVVVTNNSITNIVGNYSYPFNSWQALERELDDIGIWKKKSN